MRHTGYILAGAAGVLGLSRLLRRKPYTGGPIAWGKHPRMTRDLLQATIDVAHKIGAHPEDLLTVVDSESGFISNQFTPSGAGGLIGFMPFTLQAMGRTKEELAAESATEQMRRDVLDFFVRFKTAGRLPDVTQTKLAVFYPKAMGAPLGAIIGALDGSSSFGESKHYSQLLYHQNAGADRNRDGKITVSDIDSHMRAMLKQGKTQFFGLPDK